MKTKDPQVLHSYHPDQVKRVEDIYKHKNDCVVSKYLLSTNIRHAHDCTCTPTKGKRIVIEVWFDDAEKVKPKKGTFKFVPEEE